MLFVLLGLAFIATLGHAGGLLWAQRHQKAPFRIRENAWRWHLLINGNLWRILFFGVIVAQLYFFAGLSPVSIFFGTIFVFTGFGLAAWSYVELGGFEIAMGKRFFFDAKQNKWKKHGIYKHLRNPMYDGFLFVLIGLGVLFRGVENYYLAFASFVLLNGTLALIESKGHRWRIF